MLSHAFFFYLGAYLLTYSLQFLGNEAFRFLLILLFVLFLADDILYFEDRPPCWNLMGGGNLDTIGGI